MVYPYRIRTSDPILQDIIKNMSKHKPILVQDNGLRRMLGVKLAPIKKDICFLRDDYNKKKYIYVDPLLKIEYKKSYKTKKNSIDFIFIKK